MKEKYSYLVYTSSYLKKALLVIIFLLAIGALINYKFIMPKELVKAQIAGHTDLLTGQWQFMPGLSKQAAGYLITPVDLTISDQSGTTYIPNPPINLFGTHLEKVSGDFSISTTVSMGSTNIDATVSAKVEPTRAPRRRSFRRRHRLVTPLPTIQPLSNATAAATIGDAVMSVQFYGNVPIIADEFRVEPGSVRLTIQNNNLTVQLFDGQKQTPIITKSLAFISSDTNIVLKMTKQADNLLFDIGGKQIGTIKESGIFKSGQLWFGVDSQIGNWLISSLQAEKLSGGEFEIVDSSTLQISQHDPNGLQAQAAKIRPDFLVGSALSLGTLVADSEYAGIALDSSKLGSITPENQMKMINLQPKKGLYTFEQADALVQLAKQNGLKVHGHALVFGEANPAWFNALPVKTTQEKQVVEDVMIDHVTTVIKHFGADINSWDVVNEPIADYDNFDLDRSRVLRQNKWYQAMGEEYIIKAFSAAHLANPEATLFINEYGLEADGERWDAFISLLGRLKPQLQTANIPTAKIGVGFQAHVYEDGDQIETDILRKHIEQLEKLGFKSQISEMDVYSDSQNTQEEQYSQVFLACLTEPSCLAWRGWILSDRYDLFKGDNGQIEYGEDGLFDTDLQPRPAYKLMQKVLNP